MELENGRKIVQKHVLQAGFCKFEYLMLSDKEISTDYYSF